MRPEGSRAYHLRRAACLARKGDHAAEARELALAESTRPKTAFDHFLNGKEEYKSHRYAAAIQDFEIVVRQPPDHFWAKCLQAICYIQTRRFDAARACLDDCIRTDPEFVWLYLLRSFASGQLGALKKNDVEFDEAETDLQQALERLKLAPDPELQYTLLVNRGLVRYQRGRLDLAKADCEAAIHVKKDPFLAHAELAYVYQKQGKIDEAIEEFSRAIDLKPDMAALYRGRAALEQSVGDGAHRARAAADLKIAILHEKPDNPVLAQDHTKLGELLYADERFEDALGECQRALQVMHDYPEAHVLKIKALLQLRRFDEVVRSCDVALGKKGRKSAVLYELRGLAQAAHNDYAGAIRDYSRALEFLPDDGRLLVERGWAYLLFDSPKPALVDFEGAIKLDSAKSDARCGRGMAHAMLGDHRAAVADAIEALRLGGASPRITYNAARIYARASLAALNEVAAKGRAARLLSSNYQDISVRLVREAFEKEAPEKRAAFWRDTVQFDPALQAIKWRLKYEELIASNKKPRS